MYLGRWFGIPVRLHASTVALFVGFMAWCVWSFGLPGIPAGLALGAGVFLSVLLHELGHALVARGFGITTAHVTLYPFGGIAALEREPRSPREELLIAGAGPAVNGALFVFFGVAWALLGWRWLLVFSAMNVLMMLFNLLPAFPMDGGRVLRAALATRIGWFEASRRALQLGAAFGWGFVLLGLVLGSASALFTGVLLLAAVRAERRRVAWRWAFGQYRA